LPKYIHNYVCKPVKQIAAAFTVPAKQLLKHPWLLHEMGTLPGLLNQRCALQADHSGTAQENSALTRIVLYIGIPIKPHEGTRIGEKIPGLDTSVRKT
jgi:hypothetical protein